ncbi:hypothetical protein [Streptomyces sp. NPDC048603]|uniref:hypothetical protein n=1 Tax=Streptomyces sp. NPDC048603 TaxID=3365577 RepID=UPI0037206C0A
MSSYDHLLSSGLMPLGLARAGPVSHTLRTLRTLYAMTIVAVPAALALLCVPAVRHLTAHAEDTAGDGGSGDVPAVPEARHRMTGRGGTRAKGRNGTGRTEPNPMARITNWTGSFGLLTCGAP